MAIFAVRLSRERKELSQVEIFGKFAGAVGNYNAHVVAYPDVNWPRIAEEFVHSLGLSFNPYVAQVITSLFLLFFVLFRFNTSIYNMLWSSIAIYIFKDLCLLKYFG